MQITWRQAAAGPSWQAWDGDRPRREVVAYGGTVGTDTAGVTYWAAFIRRERLPSEYAAVEDAKAAVEAASGPAPAK
jgi:hypothetical protein